jgi:uncharacterized protein (TIGR00369 family)
MVPVRDRHALLVLWLECPMRNKPTGHETRALALVKNHCFVCGGANSEGMHLNFFYDETRGCFVCRFRLNKRFTGPPGHCHGGIIATILDEAMGKVNRLRDVVALTAQITVEYLKPVPLHQPLLVESREVRVRGRRHFNRAEILNPAGDVLARGRGTFIAIDPERMFAKHLDKATKKRIDNRQKTMDKETKMRTGNERRP